MSGRLTLPMGVWSRRCRRLARLRSSATTFLSLLPVEKRARSAPRRLSAFGVVIGVREVPAAHGQAGDTLGLVRARFCLVLAVGDRWRTSGWPFTGASLSLTL